MTHVLSLFRSAVITQECYQENMINFPSSLQNFGENVNFWNFHNNCRMNSETRVFVTTYPNKISVSFHKFGKVTDSAGFKYKKYSTSGSKAFLRSIVFKNVIQTTQCPSFCSVVC